MNDRCTLRFKAGVTQVVVGSDGRVQVGDAILHVAAAAPGAWRVTDPSGSSRLVHVASSQDGDWVHVAGDVFLIESADAKRSTDYSTPAAVGGLTAPMPATVLSIVAPEGTRVEAGAVVLVLEAMKMELPIRAPRDGTVTAIHCSEGQLVQPGMALAEIS
jgi:biotin carboxyl carrier protein